MALFRSAKKQVEQVVNATVEAAQRSLPPAPEGDAQGRRAVMQQLDYLLELIAPLPAFGMYLLDARGCIVCENIQATESYPAHDSAAIDGYAVNSRLAIPGARVRATEVTVGERLPERSDAVIPENQTVCVDGIATIAHPLNAGDGVRQAGSAVRAGEVLINAGQTLDARRCGMLAGAGFDRVLARPQPRVVVLSITAPETASAEESAAGEVSSHLIAASVKATGSQVWRVSAPLGDEAALRDLLSDQLIRADLVIVNTRVAGEQLLSVAAQMGPVDVASLALHPGTQLSFGLIGEDEVPMIFLPSDPLGAYTVYQLFVRPLMRKLMGAADPNPQLVTARCRGTLTSAEGITEVLCASVEDSGELSVVPLGQPGSQSMRDLAKADALIVLEPWTTQVGVGDPVQVIMLGDE